MNREQAEHLLDAYVLMGVQSMPKAKEALKEVILDAMTSTTYYPVTISAPKLTPWPNPTVTYSTTYPTKSDAEVDA